MSDKEKSLQEAAWEKVLDQITDSRDWIAAGLGATLAGLIALLLQWPEVFKVVVVGATGGVTLRKAWVIARQRPRLKLRAKALEELLRQAQADFASSAQSVPTDLDPRLLLQMFQLELRLWGEGAIPNEQFAQRLDELVDLYRKLAYLLALPSARNFAIAASLPEPSAPQ